MKFTAWYGIIIGVGMIAQWSFAIVSGGVPEFQTAPWAIAFHLAAELAAALVLILGGFALLRSAAWGRPALLVGLGMVIYSVIASPGYFAQLGQWPMVVMFAVVLIGALVCVRLLMKETVAISRKEQP
jgi:hypothetical protein